MDHVFIEFFSRTIDLVGKVLVAYMAIRVHHRVRHDHKIDKQVFKDMEAEQKMGFIGIGLMLFAYFLKIIVLFT